MTFQADIGTLLERVLTESFAVTNAAGLQLATAVEIPRDKSHGDFAFPCFRLAKVLRKNPALIASECEAAMAAVLEDFPSLSSASAMGPYLNFRVNKAALAASLVPGILDGSFVARREPTGERVMVEYSQPNTHKAFHVGHTRNVALGDALVRLLEWNGHEVIAVNYIGDEGTHIAKCLWYLKNHFSGDFPENNLGEFLGGLYSRATELLDFSLLTQCPMLDVVTARVTAVAAHPTQEQWLVVDVSPGDAESYQVVCGGSGFSEDDIVAYARVGARVAGRKLAAADKEGVTSYGMICSEKELGLSERNQQIKVFAEGTPLGLEVADLFQLEEAVSANEKVSDIMRTRNGGVSATLRALEAREPEIDELWTKTRQWSMDEFYRIYDWLGARFDHYFFESAVGNRGKELVLEYLEKGVFVRSEGAVGADLESAGLPFFLLLKSDGSGLYSTKDLALAQDKFESYKVDRSVYVVDASQSLHFQQVFETLKLMGYENAEKCYHLGYGLVVLPDKTADSEGNIIKMSSRAGNIIPLSELKRRLDERIKQEFLEKYRGDWPDQEIEEAARRIAIATIRYGMLNQDNVKFIVFDLDEWSARSGNTGPYLLYAYARTRSILREVGPVQVENADWTLLTHEAEEFLLNKMAKFPDTVSRVCREYKPNLMCYYLYQLCRDFSRMYDQCSVKGAENEALKVTRACLVDAFGRLLQAGLGLLGIETLERM